MNLYDECFKILKGHAVITNKVQNQNFKEKYITGADQTEGSIEFFVMNKFRTLFVKLKYWKNFQFPN